MLECITSCFKCVSTLSRNNPIILTTWSVKIYLRKSYLNQTYSNLISLPPVSNTCTHALFCADVQCILIQWQIFKTFYQDQNTPAQDQDIIFVLTQSHSGCNVMKRNTTLKQAHVFIY